MLDFKKAVFFAAHTDDEMICAGTLHRLARQGCEVHVVAFSIAATKEDRGGTEASNATVLPEWTKSMRLIGVKSNVFHGMAPSARLEEHAQEICQIAFDFCEKERPDAAFILSPDDENPAHAVVGRACERVMRGRVPVTIRCQFPWNYSIGRSNLLVQLTQEDLAVKRQVIQAYKSQHWRYEYERMLMFQTYADGEAVKVRAAERFELMRGVV